MSKMILPPPAETILWYAIHGWAMETGAARPKGWARLPAPALWEPYFRGLLEQPDGPAIIQDHALNGLWFGEVDSSLWDCIPAAFATPGFAERLEAAIDHLSRQAAPKPVPRPAQAASLRAAL